MFPFSDNVPRIGPPIVTYLLIVINCWVFMYGLRLPESRREILAFRHGFIPARVEQLAEPNPITIGVPQKLYNPRTRRIVVHEERVTLPPDSRSIVLTLFTYMFMHAGWIHLISNMWMLWIFGDNVEDRLGHAGFLIFYLLGGILAALGHWANDHTSLLPVIGASGAIAAVLGAFAVTWPWARVRTLLFIVIFITIVELPALVVLGFWFITQLFGARSAVDAGINGGVAWWAHIVGFLAGALIMPLVRSDEPEVVEPAEVESEHIEGSR